MTTILIELPDEKATRVQAAADQLGLRLDEFVERTLDVALSRKETITVAFDYVLKKNAELYRRLAQ